MGSHNILMLEHDDDDQYITRSVFADHGFNVPVTFVTDTNQLKNFLEKCNGHTHPYPSIILMTQHCGPTSALDVLKELKSSPRYSHIPIVLLGDIKADHLIKEFYAAGVSSFIRKPLTHDATSKGIRNFIAYWFETVDLV